MPVNKLSKKPVSVPPPSQPAQPSADSVSPEAAPLTALERETERDRELAMSDAEWKNLWDATEVIDMDRF